MDKLEPKTIFNEVKIEGGRTIPVPSNTLKPKIVIKPKEKK
jgi:hypothetical protein